MILHVPFTCPVCIESILLYPGRSDLSVRVREHAVSLTRTIFYACVLGRGVEKDAMHARFPVDFVRDGRDQ